ncbi:MAG: ABC-F family ATP-binding cassette domain-containing protein [Verrucomicrobia bacterium]|nr:ABC-F family ATP-binding cassette domain-containing protein [Verrucomicrobiota bacterium]
MLALSDVGKAYGGRTLFEGVSLQVNRADRVGLVGSNGVGKSTLFSLILGHESPDRGKIEWQRGVTTGHLPQESAPAGDQTVLELATAVSSEMVELQQRLRRLDAGHGEPLAEDYEARARFERLDGFRLQARAKKVLRGLGFPEGGFERPVRELSGGWVMRGHLARLLVAQPDLLLLDEPTNHLDLEALLWFQEYLRTYPGAIVVISHDRDFLNELVTLVVELRQGRMFRYAGNYDAYLEQREANERHLLAAYKNQEREIARLQAFIERFRAKNTKATQAKSKEKQIARMERIEAPAGDEAVIDFEFPQPPRTGQRVVVLRRVRCAYGQNVVYANLDFEAERGQRMVLVGPNGAGKSTLLKLLAGVLTPQSGERQLGCHVKAGYYSQYRIENLHPGWTVLEEAFDTPQRLTETFVRSVLGTFLFRGDDVFKRVSVLSGGEKSRLALVKLLLDPPNLLLMDEPTTHLDLASVDALLFALSRFTGTLVFISHDVYFIRSLANHVVHVQDGRLTHYPGDYPYYAAKIAAARAAAAAEPSTPTATPPATPAGTPSRKEQRRLQAEERQARSRERQARQDLVARLEREIAGLEARQQQLTAELERPETYAQAGRAVEINGELKVIAARLPAALGEWETAATRLAELG